MQIKLVSTLNRQATNLLKEQRGKRAGIDH